MFVRHLFSLQIASEHGIRFFETSAKANINIEKAFLTLAEDILSKVSGVLMTPLSPHHSSSITTSSDHAGVLTPA